MLKGAYELNIPIVATSDVLFLNPKKYENLYVFHKLRDNERYDKDELDNFSFKNCFFKEEEELIKDFLAIDENANEYLVEAIENIFHIVNKCNFYIKPSAPILPTFCKDESKELIKQAKEGLEIKLSLLPKEKHETYRKRLEYEISIIVSKNYSGYFLITSDFIKFAKSKGIFVGQGRGSGAGSLLSYVLDITEIDPIKYDLIFERFLNPERNSMPDLDIDLQPERREEVIQYLRDKYGEYNVAHITTFGKLQARGAIRDVCRVFRISFYESDEITKLVPQDQVNPVTLQTGY